MNEKEGADMTRKTILRQLRQHPFLQGIEHDQLVLLEDCAVPAQFKAGEVIFHQGQQADRFYLITKGKVVLESAADDGPAVVIETVGTGDLLGWSWMMPPYRWHFTARTVERTDAVFFAAPLLQQYCERDHSLGFEVHKRISAVMMKRLQAARKKMLAIHARDEKLPPVGLSPFMEQEMDTDGYADPNDDEPTPALPAASGPAVRRQLCQPVKLKRRLEAV